MTLKQANELCILAHAGQWRRPTTVVTDGWDCYKTGEAFIHSNGKRINWCNGDTFLVYEPYHTHPQAVAAMMDTEHRKILALLHDVIEDTEYMLTSCCMGGGQYIILPDKEQHEVSAELYLDLEALTKQPNQTYSQYLDNISRSSGHVIAVKLADMFHNISCNSTQRQKDKYLKAIPILLGAI